MVAAGKSILTPQQEQVLIVTLDAEVIDASPSGPGVVGEVAKGLAGIGILGLTCPYLDSVFDDDDADIDLTSCVRKEDLIREELQRSHNQQAADSNQPQFRRPRRLS